jgi:hypothetical protein
MAENKKSFLLYCDIIHTVEKLSDEQAGKLLKHALRYVNDLDPTPEDIVTEIAFEPIKQSLKRDLLKYEGIRLKNRENAEKRWADKKNATASERMQTDTKNADSDSDSDSDKYNNIDSSESNKNKKESKVNFDVFWNLYDKKVGDKEKVKKKWDNLTLEVQNKIIDYIPKYKQSKPDKQFRKDPSTFFNNKSWEDEIIETGKSSTEPFKIIFPR